MLLVAALVLIAASVALGAYVAKRPPGSLDLAVASWRGGAVRAALVFTGLGRWWGVIGVIYAALAVAIVTRAPILPVLILAIAQIFSQAMSALIKLIFRRVRPSPFGAFHEPDFSYPSGHAVTAVVLFAGFAILAWNAPLARPLTAALTLLLAICAAGIPWSRLALAAHYATDVAGGLLLGGGWLCVAFAAIGRYGLILSR